MSYTYGGITESCGGTVPVLGFVMVRTPHSMTGLSGRGGRSQLLFLTSTGRASDEKPGVRRYI